MLVEFSVANFLSIKERQTLRMDASGISEFPERVFEAGRQKLLRSAAIYGANASGKSNLLKAIGDMVSILRTSAQRQSTDEIVVQPFLLNTETAKQPSYFEVVFLIEQSQFRYGFEVDANAVKAEWLFEAKKLQERVLFIRDNDTIEVSKDFREGRGLEERTRTNALFLSVCDQFNGPLAKQIVSWFNHVLYTSGIDHDKYRKHLLRLIEAPTVKDELTAIVNNMNFGFLNFTPQKGEMDKDYLSGFSLENQQLFYDLLSGKQTVAIKTIHKQYNADNLYINDVELDLAQNESSGTNKFFDLLAPIYLAIERHGILVIDELDAKLHPLLTQAIIRLFNNPETNPKNAQLIFATHDTNLLTDGQFRRDQIWFTEKDQYGATCLYSLVEYKEEDGTKVRKDRSFETDYIQGRYGAIPYIGDFSKLFQHGPGSEN
ncbi:ATP/GTP-binding protein [Spirosoma sp. 209]|uniref:AAA family ATPase n=1 Tax=Spirosoma sp. 209 TaxID=1955701 RepID=UPI00098D303C|nr:ATP-binding protein [Spirosoma sp. 209]